MKKCIYILLAGFLVFLSMNCNSVIEASQQGMHVSKRVKIERPEKPQAAEVSEKPPVEKQQTAEAKVAAADHKATSTKKTPAEPESLAVSHPPIQPKEPEAKSNEPAQPEALSLKETYDPEESSDLVDEKQALFGDYEKYYVKKGRIDPFAPFLHKPEPKAVDLGKKEAQRRAPRTPLERVALGQLKLTAVMHLTAEQMQMAMVEDNNGKGYIVKKGTYIGENGGRVSGIEENKVIVEEKYNDVFGKISVRQIELKLQNQPGE